jgi:hypothetical protein
VSTGATSAKEAAAFLARLCDDRHTPGLLGGGGGDGPTAPKAKKPKVAPEARRSAAGEPLALAVAADDASRLAACEALGVADVRVRVRARVRVRVRVRVRARAEGWG